MKLAVASGKGGTGKTTVAVNLAFVASQTGLNVAYLDCDVEEPNGHIFLKPLIANSEPVGNLIPEVDAGKCTLCGKCSEICQYSAIICIGKKVLVYPELCHSCGGCSLVCPAEAISEISREIGQLETGRAEPVRFVRGVLNIGEVEGPSLIRKVKASCPEADLVIIDAPPGTSCPVIESIRGCDYVLLVTEPTPFGLNDLKLAVEMVNAMELPFGVVVNRAGLGDGGVREYCQEKRIEVLIEIPDDRKVAETYSRGEMASEVLPEYRAIFEKLLKGPLKRRIQEWDKG
ncbi:MAG TPA: ATP-binding protein [archaeon]|nr:ATP-binding protein [archaeon]